MQDLLPALNVIILAAGHGKRMRSSLPKVLQPLAGKPLIEHVVQSSLSLTPQQVIVVYGHGGQQIQQQLEGYSLTWVLQQERLGTGHAVLQTLEHLTSTQRSLILYGDVPLISHTTLKALCDATPEGAVGVITAELEEPAGFGRIIRNQQHEIVGIIEDRDANPEQRKIREINTGILLVPTEKLQDWLPKLSNRNAQGEYYLTDIIDMAVANHVAVVGLTCRDQIEVTGVNSKQQLIDLERQLQHKKAQQFIEQGLHIIDPARFDCRGELSFGDDVTVDINVVFEGQVSIGNHVTIEPNCILRDVTLGDNVRIAANSIVEQSVIKSQTTIGPFARIRPESTVGPNARIGNFVEVKKSQIGEGSKVNHLSYIGDTVMGNNVNMGAGTITVNYDGANKYQTVIEDRVFVGCGSQLVAPVLLQEGAFVGAGTTVTKDVPAGTLTISRAAQKTIDGWVRPSERKDK